MGSKSSKSNPQVTESNHQRPPHQSYQSSPGSLYASSIPQQSPVPTQNGNTYNSLEHPYQSYGHANPDTGYNNQINNNNSPSNQNDTTKQRSQSGKASKKSKDSKSRSSKPKGLTQSPPSNINPPPATNEGKDSKSRSSRPKGQTQSPPSNTSPPPAPNDSSGQSTGPTVQHMIPRAVFDREEFIRKHQRNKKQSTVSADGSHNLDRGDREYYTPKKEVTKPGSSESRSRDQRITAANSGRIRSRASSRTGSEAFPPLSDVDTQSINSSTQGQEETPVAGFVQVLPSEPFDGWSNLHHTPVGQNLSNESRYSRRDDGFPETDY